jgi:hypothetical protein
MIVTTTNVSNTVFEIENAIIDIAINSIDGAIYFLHNHSPSADDLNTIFATIKAVEIIIKQLMF